MVTGAFQQLTTNSLRSDAGPSLTVPYVKDALCISRSLADAKPTGVRYWYLAELSTTASHSDEKGSIA